VRVLSSKEDPDADDDREGDYEAADTELQRRDRRKLPTEPGIHRVVWDFAYQGAMRIKGAKLDAGNPAQGPLINPGTYTLKLTVDDKVLTTTLVVQADPREQLSPADREEQLQFALRVRDDINRLSQIVTQLRAVKDQLGRRNELVKDDSKAESLRKTSEELIGKCDTLEEKLHNPKALVSYDILAQRGGARLYSKLTLLYELVRDPDGAPTQGHRDVYAEHTRELKDYEAEWNQLVTGDLAALNRLARTLDIPHILVPVGKKE
jgi:hypothetical protein